MEKNDPTAKGAEESGALIPRCRCGHDRHNLMVSTEGKYTLTGWFWVTVMGVTTRPVSVSYRCRVCGEVFDRSAKPADLDALS